MRRARLYHDAFKTIVRLQAGRLKGNADDIKEIIRRALGDPKQDSDAKFAIAALADEVARSNKDVAFATNWEKPPKLNLAALFSVPNAGTAFYEWRDRIEEENKPECGEILEVYCLCLLLGFRGGKGEPDRQKIIQWTLIQVETRLGPPPDFLAGDSFLDEEIPRGGFNDRRFAQLALAATIVSAGLYSALWLDLSSFAGDLRVPAQFANR